MTSAVSSHRPARNSHPRRERRTSRTNNSTPRTPWCQCRNLCRFPPAPERGGPVHLVCGPRVDCVLHLMIEDEDDHKARGLLTADADAAVSAETAAAVPSADPARRPWNLVLRSVGCVAVAVVLAALPSLASWNAHVCLGVFLLVILMQLCVPEIEVQHGPPSAPTLRCARQPCS